MFFKAFTKYVILDCSLVFLILLKIANAVEKGFKKLISAPRLDIGGGWVGAGGKSDHSSFLGNDWTGEYVIERP